MAEFFDINLIIPDWSDIDWSNLFTTSTNTAASTTASTVASTVATAKRVITGSGTKDDPLKVDGKVFTGTLPENNVYYENGVVFVYKPTASESKTTADLTPTDKTSFDKTINEIVSSGGKTDLGYTFGSPTGEPMPGSVVPSATGMKTFNYIPVSSMSEAQKKTYGIVLSDPNIDAVFFDQDTGTMYYRFKDGGRGSGDKGAFYRDPLGNIRPSSEIPYNYSTGFYPSGSGGVVTEPYTPFSTYEGIAGVNTPGTLAAGSSAYTFSGKPSFTDVSTTLNPPPSGTDGSSTSVLKAMLRGMGFNSSIIDASTSFLSALLKDGLDYDNAVTIFLNSKDYTTKNGTKLESPFYAEYGYLNEGLVKPKTPAELYNAIEGYKEISDKYKLNSKFISKDYLKQYVKNNVTVAQFDERANTARLKAINSDPAYLESLRQLKYINESTDLTDFFLDPKLGEETLEQKRATAAFSAEAIRRAGQGITFDATRFEKTAAGLMGLGLTEAQIKASAAQGFENIAQQLAPTVKLEQIYNKNLPSSTDRIQQELEAEEFLGTASERRARLRAREIAEYSGKAGTARGVSLIRRREGII